MNYEKTYNQIIERGRGRILEGYREVHHIIPKCIGGRNAEENLVALTAREHFLCHILLVEIYPKSVKLKHALWFMSNQTNSKNNKRDYRISSRHYERVRKMFSESMKGRDITWGDKISKAKKGVSTGPQSEATKAKRKATVKKNPYRHTEEVKGKISNAHRGRVKDIEWRKKISNTHKQRGTTPPYRGIPFEYRGVLYRSKTEAAKILKIRRYKL